MNLLDKLRLPLYLRETLVLRLNDHDSLEHDAYCFVEGCYRKVLKSEEVISSSFVQEYRESFGDLIYLHYSDFETIRQTSAQKLLKLTRSLSVGDVRANAIEHSQMLNEQMSELYDNPFDSELLSAQFSASKNLATLMINIDGLAKELFTQVQDQDTHFVIKQPLLASLLLISFLREFKEFSSREVENLFLTSYFKDIGMSFVKKSTWNHDKLDDFDKNSLSSHPINSVKILAARVPLAAKYLQIIEDHNYLNDRIFSSDSPSEIKSLETMLVCITDVFVAMTGQRPYRKSYSNYQTLEHLKRLVQQDYPLEFQMFVKFILKFYR